jgi:peptidoglycan/LPS O-acetylase OafA/YrhL
MNRLAKNPLYSVQILRFIAALTVVVSHVVEKMEGQARRYHHSLNIIDVGGSFGVQVFFAISGFIMVWICFSRGDANLPTPKTFIWNRIQRIVPVYWLCTTLVLVFYTGTYFAGADDASAKLDTAFVLKSYLFVPVAGINGKMRPLLDVGWTLNYEMFFYAVFAVGLFVRDWRGIAVAAVTLASATLLTPANYVLMIWTRPIILYFVAGVAIGALRVYATRNGFALPRVPWAVPLAAMLVVVGSCSPGHITPFLAVIACALCALDANPEPQSPFGRALVRLGDASFSLYLIHSFVLLLVGMSWRKLFGGDYIFIFGLTEITLSVIVGWLFYRYVETYLGDVVRSKFRKTPVLRATATG